MESIVTFTALDWTWLIVFVLLMVGCGVVFYRLAKRSEDDFFLADRKLPWWLPAASVYATHTATDTPMWITGVVYKFGLSGLWYGFFAAWCAVSAFVSTRIFRRSLAQTQAEWQTQRFHGLGAELLRGWVAGWQVYMNMFIAGWVGIAMGKVCLLCFGWPIWAGMILFSAICAVYVLIAGFWGVIMADFQQSVIAFAVIIIVSVYGMMAAGGPLQIVDKLHALGRADMLNPFAFTGWFSGEFPVAWFLTMLMIAVLGGLGMGTTLDWYVEAQRIQSARSIRDASYSIWAGTALVLLRNAVWAVAILGFFVLNPDIKEQGVYELGWFRLGFEYLPAGMVGFFFATILAIHFSTISTILNLGAQYITRDLYHYYINPKATQQQLVTVGRWATLVILLGSFAYGMMMSEEITKFLLFAIWIMAAGIWLPNILQVVWWRFNAWGYLSSWIANLIFSWMVFWVLPQFGVMEEMPQHFQFWILMVLVAAVFLPVTMLTTPEPMSHLVKYYVQSRPIGWWGPVRREALRLGLMQAGK